jgi:hypothetical protein
MTKYTRALRKKKAVAAAKAHAAKAAARRTREEAVAAGHARVRAALPDKYLHSLARRMRGLRRALEPAA